MIFSDRLVYPSEDFGSFGEFCQSEDVRCLFFECGWGSVDLSVGYQCAIARKVTPFEVARQTSQAVRSRWELEGSAFLAFCPIDLAFLKEIDEFCDSCLTQVRYPAELFETHL